MKKEHKQEWTKRGGPYSEQVTKLPSGRKFKIGICDGKVILATKRKSKRDWILASEWPYTTDIVDHVKNIVELLKNDEMMR